MSAGQIVGYLGAVGLTGAVAGVIGAKVSARSNERVAAVSKPHEVLEADAHAFTAFMAEARLELDRLKAEAIEGRHERDELHRRADALAEQLRSCEDRHAASAIEIHDLQRQLDELRIQTGHNPQETQ